MKLLELRKNENLTQDELAKKFNLSQKTYANYENEKTQPTIETLCQIADYYGISLDYLCEHETKHLIDTSMWSETKKGVVFALEQLTEQNSLVLLGYVTHMLKQQNS